MHASRDDVLAYMSFPCEHWPQIASTNPLERVNREVKRSGGPMSSASREEAMVRLVGAHDGNQRRVGCGAAPHVF
jgi:transposase-like protein